MGDGGHPPEGLFTSRGGAGVRKPVGMGGFFLFVAGIALTVAFRDDAPDISFMPPKWFGPLMLGAGVLMLALIWLVIRY